MSITIYFNPYSHRNTFNIIENTNKQNVTKSDFNEKSLMRKSQPCFSQYKSQPTVPTITEEFFSLFESHAIIKYICINKPDFRLYPYAKKSFNIQIRVDSYLDWHQNEFTKLLDYSKEVPENRVSRLADVEGILHFFIKTFLNNGQLNYIFDLPNFTIADFRAVCDLTSLYICNFDFEKFPVLEKYILRIFFKIPELYLTHQDYFNLISKQKYKNLFIQSILARQPEQDLINLYFHPLSSPSRAVRSLFLLATIENNEKFIDILKSENKFDQHTQINQIKQFHQINKALLHYSKAMQFQTMKFYPQENLRFKAQIDSYLDFNLNQMRQITEYLTSEQKNQNEEQLKAKQKKIDQLLQFFTKIQLNEDQYKYIQNLKTISITYLSAVNEILLLVMANYEFNSVWCNLNYICQCLKLKNILQTFLIIRM